MNRWRLRPGAKIGKQATLRPVIVIVGKNPLNPNRRYYEGLGGSWRLAAFHADLNAWRVVKDTHSIDSTSAPHRPGSLT